MAILIRDPEADCLARQPAARRGVTITEAVRAALAAAVEAERVADEDPGLAEDLMPIAAEFNRLPVLDHRTADEILGHGPDGLPP